MEGEAYKCPQCGAPVPSDAIDFKSRRGDCPFCGNHIVFKRRTFNTSGGVSQNIELAIREFLDGNVVSSRRHAEDALTVAVDNLPALFIVAYIEAYASPIKTRRYLDALFLETIKKEDLETDQEEILMLMPLLEKCALHLGDYEGEILTLIKNVCPPKEAAEFMEHFSSQLILKRNDISFFNDELKNAYLEITKGGMAPKTWLSLLASLEKNPDSPIPGNRFFLVTKTKIFYETYLCPIGQILSAIPEEFANKRKFLAVYAKTKAVIESHI